MGTWLFEPGHTAAMLRARHMMVTYVRGHFKNVSGSPVFDPENPVSGYLGLKALPIHKSPSVWLVLLLDPSTWVVAVSLPYLFREAYRSRDREGMRERLSRLPEQIRGLTRKKRR